MFWTCCKQFQNMFWTSFGQQLGQVLGNIWAIFRTVCLPKCCLIISVNRRRRGPARLAFWATCNGAVHLLICIAPRLSRLTIQNQRLTNSNMMLTNWFGMRLTKSEVNKFKFKYKDFNVKNLIWNSKYRLTNSKSRKSKIQSFPYISKLPVNRTSGIYWLLGGAVLLVLPSHLAPVDATASSRLRAMGLCIFLSA